MASDRTHDPLHLDFELPDPDRRFAGVRLWTDAELGHYPPPVDFTREGRVWHLRLETPPIDRLEYQFVARLKDDAGEEYVLDPENERTVGGAFGDKSERVLPGYRRPHWLEHEPVAAQRHDYALETDAGPVELQVWSPEVLAADEEAPLLLAHDGPEFDELAGLTRAVGVAIAHRRLAPTRVALLRPGPRDERYAANDDYAAALATQVVPEIAAAHPTSGSPVLLGASLGGLAALHAHWRHPGTFGGLFLASASFFTPKLDPQEANFSRFAQVTDFVREVAETREDAAAVRELPPVAIVCGTAEENLANNMAMRQVLTAWRPPTWHTVRDGHCYTTWRDLLDPTLVDLLARAAP